MIRSMVFPSVSFDIIDKTLLQLSMLSEPHQNGAALLFLCCSEDYGRVIPPNFLRLIPKPL